MPTKKQLEQALIGADKAGDVEAARILANSLKNQEYDFDTGTMVSNIPKSAREFASNIAQPFLHPVDTAENVGNLGKGVIDKLARIMVAALPNDFVEAGNQLNNWLVDIGLPMKRVAENKEDMQFENEKYADAMGQFFKDRYGTMANFKKTAMKDPVGVLADASMVLTSGGAVVSKLPGLNKVGQVVQKAGMAVEPLNAAKNAIVTGIAKATSKSKPVEWFESSAKFSTTFPKAKRQSMAKTALDHGIVPTAKGLDKLDALVSDLNNRITVLIDDATKAGKTIPKKAIYRHLKEARQKIGGVRSGADKNLTQINKVAKEFNLQLQKIKKSKLTPNELQEIKTSFYDDINFDAKQLRSQKGVDAGRKAIARAAKESIEGVADVKGVNKQIGDLLELKKPLGKASGRIENRDIIGIGPPIKIGAAGAAGGDIGAGVGLLASIFENPHVKARMAVKMKQLQDAGIINMVDNNLAATLAHYGLLQSSRLEDLPLLPGVPGN